MPVEITILSGLRQGDRIELTEKAFEVGDRPSDAVYFDPATDTDVKDRRASLRLENDGWRVRSTGHLPIMVNQDPVERSHALRSGDIVRMSENGPDFCFTLIHRLTPTSAPKPSVAEPTAEKANSTLSEVPWPAGAETFGSASTPLSDLSGTEARDDKVLDRFSTATIGTVLATFSVLILAINFMRSGGSVVPTPPSPHFAPIPLLEVEEGNELVWRPEVLDAEGVAGLTYALTGEVPKGMHIDRDSGAIRWTPTEEQAPGEYSWQIAVTWTSDSQPQTSTAKLVCDVRESNQSPTLEAIPPQTLDLLKGGSLDLVLVAADSDQPAQQLTYQLGANAPSGMHVNASSGRITWTPQARHANQTFDVIVVVSDDFDPPSTATNKLSITVNYPDPWETAAENMSRALYMVAVQPTDSPTVLPLGTACAITADTLLTSATVATSLYEGQQRGWKVVAIESTKLDDFQSHLVPIIDVKAHVGYAKADPATQVFFDLGLLKVEGQLAGLCQLATADSLLGLAAEPKSLGCIGFAVRGGPLTRFDLPTADLKRADLYSVIRMPADEGGDREGPPLLQLSGTLAANPFGSPIITRDAQLLGIYATHAELPEDAQAPSIHYATVVTLVSAWLAGEGRSHWVQPEPTAKVGAVSPNKTPSKQESN